MSETQNFKNIGWSHGLQGRKSESTTPHLRGCVLELACRRSDRPGRSRNLGNRKSARMQKRRASRCVTLSFFLVASMGDATRGAPRRPRRAPDSEGRLKPTSTGWTGLAMGEERTCGPELTSPGWTGLAKGEELATSRGATESNELHGSDAPEESPGTELHVWKD